MSSALSVDRRPLCSSVNDELGEQHEANWATDPWSSSGPVISFHSPTPSSKDRNISCHDEESAPSDSHRSRDAYTVESSSGGHREMESFS